MQVKSTTEPKAPSQTISAEVLERMENEWRQMRQMSHSAPQPTISIKAK